MTLGELVDALSWPEGKDENPEYTENQRKTLLLAALYGDDMEKEGDKYVFSGVSEDQRYENARQARLLLGPVWLQAVEVLKRAGFPVETHSKQE